MKTFSGCTALVTGASSGLGSEFAKQLAPHASTLILVARRIDRLDALKAELLQQHPSVNVYSYGIDLSDDAAIDAFLRWLWNEGLRVNFLINNAGLGDRGEFQSGDWNKIKMMLDVNISALTKLTHRLLPMLRTFGDAAILNVSSSASFLPVPHFAVYAATKAYVTSFSEALRAELRGTGVSVTALCPGPVETEFNEVAKRDADGNLDSPEIFVVSPENVVELALLAVRRDRARIIPGMAMSFLAVLICITPMFILRLFLNIGAIRMRGGKS